MFLLSLVLRILVIGSLIFSLVKGFLYILARNVFDHKVGQIPLVVTKGPQTGARIRVADITSEDDRSFRHAIRGCAAAVARSVGQVAVPAI